MLHAKALSAQQNPWCCYTAPHSVAVQACIVDGSVSCSACVAPAIQHLLPVMPSITLECPAPSSFACPALVWLLQVAQYLGHHATQACCSEEAIGLAEA